MKNKIKYCLVFVFFIIKTSFSQNTNIVNCSSVYSNIVEYNTGEIFVVYNFSSNQVTSKIVENTENNNLLDVFAKVKIYPNPTASVIYYSLPNGFSFEKLELHDQYQKIIFSSTENTKQISLENFPSGIYYIMFNGNKEHNYKIIKN